MIEIGGLSGEKVKHQHRWKKGHYNRKIRERTEKHESDEFCGKGKVEAFLPQIEIIGYRQVLCIYKLNLFNTDNIKFFKLLNFRTIYHIFFPSHYWGFCFVLS